MGDRMWRMLMGASLLATVAVGFLPEGTVVRTVVMLWFLLWAPGAAVVRFFLPLRGAEELVLAPALSLAMLTLASLGLIKAGLWAPQALLGGLLVACAAVWIRDLARSKKTKGEVAA